MERIIRREFWREFEEVQRRVNQIFEDFFRQTFPVLESPIVFSPPLNVYQTANELIIHAVIPGALEEDIDITIDGRILTMRGELTEPVDSARAEHFLNEWRYGYFERQVALPLDVQIESVRISYADGVLEIRFRLSDSTKV